MRKPLKITVILSALAAALLLLAACGGAPAAPAATASPTASPAPTPIPTPDPTPVPPVILGGEGFDRDCETLSLAGKAVDAAELAAAAPEFTALRAIDLTGCDLSAAELRAVSEAFPDAALTWELELYGVPIRSDDTEIDLSGIPIDDTAPIADAAGIMPQLERVIMCDCGVPDEEMDALNHLYENVRFVWTVYFSVYSLRTDAETFIASLAVDGGMTWQPLTDETVGPLRYCTELVALDLGHMYFTDISFMENMTKLKWLIIAECSVADLSPLAKLPELYYLEAFITYITDITPLLECRNLRHLNLSYCNAVKDITPLYEMTWLERLWYCGPRINYTERQALEAALPDTEMDLDPGGESSGGTWRTHDAYFEMRDIFGVYYLPGGTHAEG